MSELTKYEQAEYLGIKNRLAKLAEECGDLTRVTMKYLSGLETEGINFIDNRFYKDRITEAMSHVYLLCSEVRYLLDIHSFDVESLIDKRVNKDGEYIKYVKNMNKTDKYISQENLYSVIEEMSVYITSIGKVALDDLLDRLQTEARWEDIHKNIEDN